MADVSGQWSVVREVLPALAARFADLITSTATPDALATPDWTVAETAAHVAGIATMYTAILAPGGGPVPIRPLASRIPTITVDTVAELNDLALRHFTERDPAAIAATIRSTVDTILGQTEHTDPERPVPWLGDSKVPVAGILAHLTNELLIHGWDIARAVRCRWAISSREAAPFFDLFMIGMIRNEVGRLWDVSASSDRRVAVAFRSRHTAPVTLVLHQGRVAVEEPGGPVDIRLRFDPATLPLVLFGRVSRIRAALTGKLIVTGRRPWLLPAFLRTVRLPTNALPRSVNPAG